MTTNFKTLNFTYIARTAPKNGPTSSDAWNDSFSELAIDLASISSEWNDKIVTLFSTLPIGDLTDEIDAFTSGLDGTTLWVDSSLISTSDDLTFFSSAKNRPLTIEESLREIYTYVDNQLDGVTETILASSEGLTTAQKNRIGANVFNSSSASSSSSIDGKSENNRLNIIQLAADLYGAGYTLDSDGTANLTNSVKSMVDALLELHNGNWSDDIVVDHSSIPIPDQTDIDSSYLSENDSLAGNPANLKEDLDQIKTYIKTLKGTGGWKTALTALYTGGADSIQDLLVTTTGTGTKSSTNPWGYNYSDVDGLNTRLEAIKTFTGQTTQTDAAPTYISTYTVRTGDGLELSIGNLDRDLYSVSGINTSQNTQLTALESFTGQTNDTDSTPTFTTNYSVTPGMNLEQAIGRLDNNLYVTSGIVNSGINHIYAVGTFTGQNSPTDNSPNYAYNNYVVDGTSLETAIGVLDNSLSATVSTITDHGLQLAALETFTGQNSNTDSTPGYSSNYSVNNGMSLETAIGRLDNNLYTTSGIVNSGINHIYAVSTFVGQNSLTDNSPSYSNTNYVVNGESLETSIGRLDGRLAVVSGTVISYTDAIESFVGQSSNTDSLPTFTSNYSVTPDMNLEQAIGRLDNNLYTTSGVVNSGINHIYAVGTFTGQGSPTDNSPSYSSTSYITNGDSLETAIGKLDNRLTATSGTIVTNTTQLDALESFVGQTSNTDNSPTYTSTTYISNGNSLETAIGKLDDRLTVTSGTVVSHTHSSYLNKDGSVAMIGNLNLNSYKVASLGTPTLSTDAATKDYVDSNITTVNNNNSLYLLTDGSRQMGGNLSMSGNNIYNVATTYTTATNTYNITNHQNIVTTTLNASGIINSVSDIKGNNISTTNNIVSSGTLTASGIFRAEVNAYVGRDLEITASSYGVVMSSPNGQKWRITIGDFGELTTTAI